MKKYLNENHLSKPNFSFEIVNRASQACGPLVKWLIAQLTYIVILDKVKPLREELETLGAKSLELQEKQTN